MRSRIFTACLLVALVSVALWLEGMGVLLLGVWVVCLYELWRMVQRWDRWLPGAVYLSLSAAAAWWLYERSPVLLVWVLVVTASYDTFAYLVGTRWGRRKILPRLSPEKTWAGTMGGLLMGILAGVLWRSEVAPMWSGSHMELYVVEPWPVLQIALFSAVFVLAAFTGDALESAVKRYHRIKDSGRWLGQHGGVLDRVDSHSLALPVAALVL